MAISNAIQKQLWANSYKICANPNCKGDLTNIGEICHIIAKSQNGPRGNYQIENRDSYENLIILCNNCHALIDSNPEDYTVDLLKSWKQNHSRMPMIQNQSNVIIDILEAFTIKLNYHNGFYTLPEANFSISQVDYDNLYKLIYWINHIDWLSFNYLELKNSLVDFANNINKTLNTFNKHNRISVDNYFETEKFYKSVDYYTDSIRRESLEVEYDKHIDTLINQTKEVESNFNEVLRIIRRDFNSNYLDLRAF